MSKERRFRSDSYQYLIKEIQCDFTPGAAASDRFSNEQGLYQSTQQSEQILQLSQRLHHLMFSLPRFTTIQQQVIEGMQQGLTQAEIAKRLNKKNQAVINKIIHGNQVIYGKKQFYGGIELKVRKVCLKSEEFRALAQQIFQLNEGAKILRIVRDWFVNQEDYLDWLDTPLGQDGTALWIVEMVVNKLARYYIKPRHILIKNLSMSQAVHLTHKLDLGFVGPTTVQSICKNYYSQIQQIMQDLPKDFYLSFVSHLFNAQQVREIATSPLDCHQLAEQHNCTYETIRRIKIFFQNH